MEESRTAQVQSRGHRWLQKYSEVDRKQNWMAEMGELPTNSREQLSQVSACSPRIQSSCHLASDSPALCPRHPPSRQGSYMPRHVSSVSFSYSNLWLSWIQYIMLPHPSGGLLSISYIHTELDTLFHPRVSWDSIYWKRRLLSIIAISC